MLDDVPDYYYFHTPWFCINYFVVFPFLFLREIMSVLFPCMQVIVSLGGMDKIISFDNVSSTYQRLALVFYRPSFSPLFFALVLSLFFGSCGFISSLPQLAWD
jgi:hypothetical protein